MNDIALSQANKLGKMLEKSEMLPPAYRDHPESIPAALLMADAMGVPHITMLNNSYPVDGRVSVQPALLMAVAKKHPQYAGLTIEQDDIEGCKLTLRRRINDNVLEEYVGSFTKADATRAGLMGRGMYAKYPREMFYARALTIVLRRAFPDAGLAGVYAPEELDNDIELKNVNPEPATATLETIAAEVVEEEIDAVEDELIKLAKEAGFGRDYVVTLKKQWRAVKDKPQVAKAWLEKKRAVLSVKPEVSSEQPS